MAKEYEDKFTVEQFEKNKQLLLELLKDYDEDKISAKAAMVIIGWVVKPMPKITAREIEIAEMLAEKYKKS